jgi:hypothetical protein
MSDSLSEGYLQWLGPQIRDEENEGSGAQYWDLLSLMYEKEFTWSVHNDENRLGDGLDLRTEYSRVTGASRADLLALGPCSFLEVLIGLSRRLEFSAGGSARGWAWILLGNLGLHKMVDPLNRRKVHKVDDILDTVIGRTYQPDGTGGFFPLAWPDDDQTQIELWYQMAAYIEELHPEH